MLLSAKLSTSHLSFKFQLENIYIYRIKLFFFFFGEGQCKGDNPFNNIYTHTNTYTHNFFSVRDNAEEIIPLAETVNVF